MMDNKIKRLADYYDRAYERSHYFTYRKWLYGPFIKALMKKLGAEKGSKILDLGCGQGFFSSLFAELGLKPVGVDVSAQAILSAKREYGSLGISFETGEVLSLPYVGTFDYLFVRGLSLYNVKPFVEARPVTDTLAKYLKPTGKLIFAYASNFSSGSKSSEYIHHTCADAREHFASYPGTKVYFSLRIETLLLGSLAFRLPFTYASMLISKITGLGGELIAIVPVQPPGKN